MADSVHAQFSFGKSGEGIYGQITRFQGHFNVECIKDRVFSAVDSIIVHDEDKHLFTMADMGTSDGSISMPLITELIERIRNKYGEIPVQIVYEDQASNDFNSVFRRVHGIIQDQPTYLKRFSQVYTMASGTSFFEQVLPDNSAQLLMSFSAAHYLSVLPTKFQNSLHRFPDATEEEKRLVDVQAAKDWDTFLWHRVKELKSGGVLFVTLPCDDPEMKIDGQRHDFQGIEEAMLLTWRKMRDDGKITPQEFLDTNIQRCTRYRHEIKAPFEDTKSRAYKAGLRLMEADVFYAPCVRQKKWQQTLDEGGKDTSKAWAESIVHQQRLWTNNVFLQGLADSRSQQEKESLVNELYQRIEKEILAQGPRKFRNGTLLNYIFARKI